MKVTIVGGSGFAGVNLAFYLNLDHEIQVVDNFVRRGSELNIWPLHQQGIEVRHGDARNKEDWVGIDGDVLLMCAAQPSAIDGYANPRFDISNNTISVLNALEYCKERNAGIVFWSTNKVYPQWAIHDRDIRENETRFNAPPVDETTPLDGQDRSLYGLSKLMSDLMIQEWSDIYGFPAVINRFSCLSGEWQWGKSAQGWLAFFVIAHRLNIPLEYCGFQGKQVRDVLHVNDMCRLVDRQITDLHPGPRVFNVGGGLENTISLIECTEYCQEITGQKVPIRMSAERRADFKHYVSDISKVTSAYNWAPEKTVSQTLDDINKWVGNNIDQLERMYL